MNSIPSDKKMPGGIFYILNEELYMNNLISKCVRMISGSKGGQMPVYKYQTKDGTKWYVKSDNLTKRGFNSKKEALQFEKKHEIIQPKHLPLFKNVAEDYIYTIENLMKAMENIPYNNENFVSLVNIEESEKQLKDMELKQYRMIAANEGYYNTIIKLINLQPSKKNEMIAYARKSLTIYTANQKAISKMNTSVTKTREKFDRIRRKFDERMSASAN